MNEPSLPFNAQQYSLMILQLSYFLLIWNCEILDKMLIKICNGTDKCVKQFLDLIMFH